MECDCFRARQRVLLIRYMTPSLLEIPKVSVSRRPNKVSWLVSAIPRPWWPPAADGSEQCGCASIAIFPSSLPSLLCLPQHYSSSPRGPGLQTCQKSLAYRPGSRQVPPIRRPRPALSSNPHRKSSPIRIHHPTQRITKRMRKSWRANHCYSKLQSFWTTPQFTMRHERKRSRSCNPRASKEKP